MGVDSADAMLPHKGDEIGVADEISPAGSFRCRLKAVPEPVSLARIAHVLEREQRFDVRGGSAKLRALGESLAE